MDKQELNALLSLLDDPDKDVFLHVREKLLSIGEKVIPVLENVWEQSFDINIQTKIEGIIHNIQFNTTAHLLKEWASTAEQNLFTGALLIAKYQYPDLDETKLKRHIQQIRQDVWLELNDKLTALEQVKIINHILFDVHNFSGNTQNYHAPQNSYINNVLESKKGNPLSLSLVYLIVAQDLKIPIYGVNLPEHFVLCYKDVHQLMTVKTKRDEEMIAKGILFYINPFSRGAVFGKGQLDVYLKKMNLDIQPTHYQPCSNLEMIKRLLRNLIFSYKKLGYVEKQDELQGLLNALG
ncbi:MAG: transglutaminase-like domain-containing protein [Bacteroidia bacterium]